ncbi:MAG: hypothetical protein ACTH7X_08995 [Brevibacterium aurantiacum]
MTDYEYDPKLPYVLVNTLTGDMMGRATSRLIAKNFSAGLAIKIIDTTPKPRVPEDAKYITWVHRNGERWYAESGKYGWVADSALYDSNPDALPGVTPDTVFTVLEERKS